MRFWPWNWKKQLLVVCHNFVEWNDALGICGHMTQFTASNNVTFYSWCWRTPEEHWDFRKED